MPHKACYSFTPIAANNDAIQSVQEVRDYLNTITGFQSIHIIAQDTNQGLASSIITGVSEVINTYGTAIILEDDIVVSSYFLQFMNEALDFYEGKKSVWNITGYQYQINTKRLKHKTTAFTRQMGCWGWATWKNRWQYFEKNPKNLLETFSEKDIYEFDFCNKRASLFWSQVKGNVDGVINTWAIFWYTTIFQHKGLCLEPIHSFVDNIGFDGSGEHCNTDDNISTNRRALAEAHWTFSQKVIEDKVLFQEKRKIFYPEVYGIKKTTTPIKRMGFYIARYSKKPLKEKFLSIGRVVKKMTGFGH